MRRDRLWERSERLGTALRHSLADLADSPHVGEVRGLGLFIGIELVTDDASRAPDSARAGAIRRAAFERGVLVGIAGHADNVLKLCPPLTIDEHLLDAAVGILVESIKGAP
jgi:4-aminobutyrate aminotransferase-like enzyme